MLRKVKKALEDFSPDITFLAAGESIGIGGIQPDLLAQVKTDKGDTSRRVAIQIRSSNKADYEAESALKLSKIEQIDMVIVVTKKKGSRKLIERNLKQKIALEGLEYPVLPVLVDFETCIDPEYDWSFIFG